MPYVAHTENLAPEIAKNLRDIEREFRNLGKTTGTSYSGSSSGGGGGGGIPEAPIDGKQYARKDAAWDVVASLSFLDGGEADTIYGGIPDLDCGGAT